MSRKKNIQRLYELTKIMLNSSDQFSPNITNIAKANNMYLEEARALQVFWRKYKDKFELDVRIRLKDQDEQEALDAYLKRVKIFK